MRLSPVLVALLATSATVGLSDSANAQSSVETLPQAPLHPLNSVESSSDVVKNEGVFQQWDDVVAPLMLPGLSKTDFSVKFSGQLASVDGIELALSKSTKSIPTVSSNLALHKQDASNKTSIRNSLSRIQTEWEFKEFKNQASHQKKKQETLALHPSAEVTFQFNKTKSNHHKSFNIALSKPGLDKSDRFQIDETIHFNKNKLTVAVVNNLSLAKADLGKTYVEELDGFQLGETVNFNKNKQTVTQSENLSLAKANLEKLDRESLISFQLDESAARNLSLAKETLENKSVEIPLELSLNKVKPRVEVPFEGNFNKPETFKFQWVQAETETNPIEPPLQPTPSETQPSESQPPEPQVLVAEIVIEGVDDPELEARIYDAIATEPGRTTTRTLLQQDINSVFALGVFRNVRATPEDTPLGVRITFEVELNPPLTAVVIEGDEVLPPEVVEETFADQYGQLINLNEIEDSIQNINTWYQENGYVLAQIVEAPEVTPDGTITLQVAEGIIEEIRVKVLNSDGEETDEEGNPIEGNTREFIITREIELKPGDVFNQQTAQRDLRRVFDLGIFEDVRLELEPGTENPRQAVMVVNTVEKSTGSIAVGGGVSSATGLFGTVSYQEINLGGNNQQLAAEVQLGERILLLDVSFTDPWIAGDPYRTSYTINAFRRREVPNIFEEGDEEVRLPNGDRVRIIRTGGGISFSRPFAETPFVDPDWIGSVGFRYQRVQATDADIDVTPRDDAGKLLTASESGEDDLITFQFGIARDRRNNRQFPTSGYLFRVATEQSVPVGSGSIFYNRLRANYTFYVPVKILEFIPGAPQTIAFNLQAGTILGGFPPYESFSLGGANTVRGWEEGALAVARTFVLGSVEYRFPIFGAGSFLVGGALFVDAATALGSQSTVQGNPGGIRGKPGTGVGFGGGLRIQSPVGPIRIDYGINNEGDGQVHFGIGERF